MDPLVTQALRFLGSAVAAAHHAATFSAPGTLAAIIERIVVPNVALRDAGASTEAARCACPRGTALPPLRAVAT